MNLIHTSSPESTCKPISNIYLKPRGEETQKGPNKGVKDRRHKWGLSHGTNKISHSDTQKVDSKNQWDILISDILVLLVQGQGRRYTTEGKL